MREKRLEIGTAVILVLLPIAVILSENTVYTFFRLDAAYSQLIVDAAMFMVAFVLNHYWIKVKVDPFNTKKPVSQFLNMIPGIVMLAITGKFSPLGTAKNVILAIATVLMVAIAEEFVFRGLLIPVMYKLVNQHLFIALIISAFGFGSIHLINLLNHFPMYLIGAQVFMAAATGMLYGALYVKTHNLTLPIILHVITDLPIFFPRPGTANAASELTGNQRPLMVIFMFGLFLISCLVAYLQIRKTKVDY